MNSSKVYLIELMFKDTQTQKAEIIWALKTVMSNYSNNSGTILNRLFLCLFPDSKIALLIGLGPRKLKYIVTFGIAVHFIEILNEKIKKIDCYVTSFDESLNDMTQNCQMGKLFRFFDPVEDRVKVHYLDSKFL